MAQQQISAQQRAMLFAQATRQTYQTLPSVRATMEHDTISFQLPKARLLSKIILQVNAVATVKGPNQTVALHPFSPYGIIRHIRLDLNNGFSPYTLEGKDAFLYALNRFNPEVLYPGTDKRGMTYAENKCSAAGVDNAIKFDVHLPITLNDRDAVGLVLLQNEETSVTVSIDVGEFKNAYKLATGETATFKSFEVTPLVETYTVPPTEIARPDLSVLKLVQSKGDTFKGNGQEVVRLQTGTIYRKLALYFEDEAGNPLEDTDFQGNLEFVFNTADVPISIKPSMLAAKNHSEFGHTLPKGVYIFDWSNQGIPNLGGTRDYIDTERLTEFWLRFTPTKAGKVSIVPETLSRLG